MQGTWELVLWGHASTLPLPMAGHRLIWPIKVGMMVVWPRGSKLIASEYSRCSVNR